VIKHYIVNGKDRYTIRFDVQSNATYKLFALSHPPDPFGKGVSQNHLYSSGEICVVAGYEPRTLERARAIAKYWCDGWSKYIVTGTFPNEGMSVEV
jgi:hypothetical protein